jgi:hypothetical protein
MEQFGKLNAKNSIGTREQQQKNTKSSIYFGNVNG